MNPILKNVRRPQAERVAYYRDLATSENSMALAHPFGSAMRIGTRATPSASQIKQTALL